MILSIEPLKGFEWECGYGAIVAAAKFFNCEYQLTFRDLWKFNYIEPKSIDASLGSQIATEQSEITELLYDYCNFKVTDLCLNDISQVISKMKGELKNNKPVKLRMDLYWCPWHKEAYKILHIPHSFLIIGFDEKNDIFRFIDHSPLISDGILNIAELPDETEYTITTFDMEDKKKEQVDWRLFIKECCDRVLGNTGTRSIFELQRSFARRVLDGFNFNNEYKGNERFLQTDLYKNLIRIFQDRYLYSQYLQFNSEKFQVPELSKYVESFNIAADKWDNIKNIFVKASMFENPGSILDRISNKIIQLSEFEEKTAYELMEVTASRS